MDILHLRIYEFDDTDFLQWLAVVLKNRQIREIENSKSTELDAFIKYMMAREHVDLGDYDCAIGWRADVCYEYVCSYVTGVITRRIYIDSLRKCNLGRQFVLLSKKAFDTIKLVGTETVDYSLWDVKSKERAERDIRAVRLSSKLRM